MEAMAAAAAAARSEPLFSDDDRYGSIPTIEAVKNLTKLKRSSSLRSKKFLPRQSLKRRETMAKKSDEPVTVGEDIEEDSVLVDGPSKLRQLQIARVEPAERSTEARNA